MELGYLPKSTKSLRVNVTGLYSAYFSISLAKDEEPPANLAPARLEDRAAHLNSVNLIIEVYQR